MPDSLEPDLIEVPGGGFTMGDVWGDGELDERPVTTHHVDTFLLGRYAVTVAQYVEFLNARGEARDDDGRILLSQSTTHVTVAAARFRCVAGYERHPVTHVSWYGARAYAKWLSEVTGRASFLPTEVQWQYASLGGRNLKWSLGDEFDAAEYVLACNAPQPVDGGRPSPWGFYQLTGNVFEWCDDEYRFSLADTDEDSLRNNRVIKGGAFVMAEAASFRNAKRFSCQQASCLSSIGFRVAAEVHESYTT